MSTIGPFADLKPTELAVLEGYMEPVTFPQDACIVPLLGAAPS